MAESKLDTVIRREFWERVRSPWFAVSTLVGPVVLLVMLAIPIMLSERERRIEPGVIAILDATPDSVGQLATALVDDLRRGAAGVPRAEWISIDAARQVAAEGRAARDVLAGRYVGFLTLDRRGLERGLVRYVGRNTTALVTMQQLEGAVARASLARNLERVGLDEAHATSLASSRLELQTERLTARGLGGSGQVSVVFALSVALLLYGTIVMHGANVMRGVLEEKESRVAEVVLSSVPSDTLLFGKVLGIGSVGFLQLSIWTLVSGALIAVRQPVLHSLGIPAERLTLPDITPELAIIILLTFVLGFLFYAALFASVGALVSSEQEAQQAQLPVVMLLALTLAMVQGVITNPDGRLAVWLTYLPISSPIVLPLRLSLTPVPDAQSILALGILTIAALTATVTASRLYRLGVLMYGKRATLREMWQWLVAQ